MPKKKSIKKAAKDFAQQADSLVEYLKKAEQSFNDGHITWCYEYAVIRLYRCFESLMLEGLVGAINNDTATLTSKTGFSFPKHLTDEVCRYIVVGDGYFDFKGRGGLIKLMKRFVPESHYLVTVVKEAKYKDDLDRLSALRNFAAHGSSKSKQAALKATKQSNMSSSGAWLKKNNRFKDIVDSLKGLAQEINNQAPY